MSTATNGAATEAAPTAIGAATRVGDSAADDQSPARVPYHQ